MILSDRFVMENYGPDHLPGLVNIQKTIEHGPVEIVDLPIDSMVIFHSYVTVYQRVYHSPQIINGPFSIL